MTARLAVPSPHVLAFAAPAFDALKDSLLSAAPLESAAFVLARPVRTPCGSWRLVAYDVMVVAEDGYAHRSVARITLPPSTMAPIFGRARREQAALLLTHTHPGGELNPSRRDREGESLLIPALQRLVPDVPHGRLIIGPDAVHATLFPPTGGEEILRVTEVGPDVQWLNSWSEPGQATDEAVDRQVRALGADGQRLLSDLRVTIVGLGGTGSIVAEQLAHLGVRQFLLIDPDRLELTNCNRVVGASRADVGRLKVDIARDLIARISTEAMVEALAADVCDQPVVRRILDTDFFMLCTDSHGSRAVLNQLAYQYVLPGIDLGVVIDVRDPAASQIVGRVQMLGPRLPCLLCGSVLDAEAVRRDLLTPAARAQDPYILGAAVPAPAVISVNGATASLAVTMLLSAVTGVKVASRHQLLRLHAGVVSILAGSSVATCPNCSDQGFWCRGDTWSVPGRLV